MQSITVKSEAKNTAMVFFLFLCSVTASLLMLFFFQNAIIAIVLFLITCILCMRQWVATGKTLIIDGNGVTVKFLWIHKHYSWWELKTKRIVSLKNSYGYKDSYTKCVELSSKKILRPHWIKPAEYCTIFHPVTYLFLYFPTKEQSVHVRYPSIYEIDERLFTEAISEWGIIFENN